LYLLRQTPPFQGTLAAPLQRFHLEGLIQSRAIPVGEQAVVSTARDEHKSRVAGGKRISNRRDGPALEIGVEYCKIELGFPRRLQCLIDSRGLGSDGISEITSRRSAFESSRHLRQRGAWLVSRAALRLPLFTPRLVPTRNLPMHCGRPRATETSCVLFHNALRSHADPQSHAPRFGPKTGD